MDSNWLALVSAVLAGGLLTQVFNTIWGDRVARAREFRHWRRVEKFKVYTELMDVVSSSTPEFGYDKWPSIVRTLSQRVYLLHSGGRPPQALCDSLEEAFQLSRRFRESASRTELLKDELKTTGSLLRRELAKSLQSDE